jgi:hypothetical protein
MSSDLSFLADEVIDLYEANIRSDFFSKTCFEALISKKDSHNTSHL